MTEAASDNPPVPWGGKRPGAGRKTAPTGKRETISTRVDAVTAQKIRAEAEKRGIPMGQIIDELAEQLPEADR